MIAVAPYMGAWIETLFDIPARTAIGSLPIWERGLKLLKRVTWMSSGLVAPYMGAWIETYNKKNRVTDNTSLPIWERGLKL